VRNFIGREETLSKIDYYFSTADVPCPKVLILHALGGQGKSQIALKYCQKSREGHRGIFWINASSEITTREVFERIATILDETSPSGLGDSDQKIEHVLRTLERWKTHWILVFDNYDSPEAFDVRNFFPRSTSLYTINSPLSTLLIGMGRWARGDPHNKPESEPRTIWGTFGGPSHDK
jgi:hypothetical protein